MQWDNCKCKAQKVLVSWYDLEYEQEDSEILENIAPGDAITVVSEGNSCAIDISVEILVPSVCSTNCKCR